MSEQHENDHSPAPSCADGSNNSECNCAAAGASLSSERDEAEHGGVDNTANGQTHLECPTCSYKNDPGTELCEVCDQRIANDETMESDASYAAFLQAQEQQQLFIVSGAKKQTTLLRSPQDATETKESEAMPAARLAEGSDSSLAAFLQAQEQEQLFISSDASKRAALERLSQDATKTKDSELHLAVSAARHAEESDSSLAAFLQAQEEISSGVSKQTSLEGSLHNAANSAEESDLHLAISTAIQAERDRNLTLSTLTAMNGGSHSSFAAMLQMEEVLNATKEHEDLAMQSTNQGRAWLFVKKVVDLHRRLEAVGKGNPLISTISIDDLVFLAERFLEMQTALRRSGHPCKVVLLYHYTSEHFIGSIRQGGLLSSAERAGWIDVDSRGAYFGDGIYTATNPFAFSNYGNVGLLVAVLLGNSQRIMRQQHEVDTSIVDSVIGNKLLPSNEYLPREQEIDESVKFFDEYVLSRSSQCLPLIRFCSSLISTSNDEAIGNGLIWAYHEELQKEVDEFFNGGSRTSLKRILPSMNPKTQSQRPPSQSIGNTQTASSRSTATAQTSTYNNQFIPHAQSTSSSQAGGGSNQQIHRSFPRANRSQAVPAAAAMPRETIDEELLLAQLEALRTSEESEISQPQPTASESELLRYEAPTSRWRELFSAVEFGNQTSDESNSICGICFREMNSQASNLIVRLSACRHIFHHDCIIDSLNSIPKCPICSKFVGMPRGKSPSGEMIITRTPMICAGYQDSGRSIAITYSLKRGMQMPYHERPGFPYESTRRVAYLPDNDDGRTLLKRLKKAWMKGLTFSVGTSLSSGTPNSIVWASIPHKTSLSGGVARHGFPDPTYFYNCNQVLDSLGVPPSHDC